MKGDKQSTCSIVASPTLIPMDRCLSADEHITGGGDEDRWQHRCSVELASLLVLTHDRRLIRAALFSSCGVEPGHR